MKDKGLVDSDELGGDVVGDVGRSGACVLFSKEGPILLCILPSA